MFYKKNTTEKLSDELFKNPTSEYRGTPFWAWNCKMDAEMLGEQIDALREMGFGGFHMHSRSGMAMPYLQKEFMELVRFCTDKAKSENMLAYLYDEDRWPSGSAGGIVTKNPRFRQKKLIFTVTPREHFPQTVARNEGKPYLAAAYDITLNAKGELESYSRIAEDDSAKGTKWYAYIVTNPANDPWYNNQAYVDTLDKESMDEFIRVTYEAYKDAVGDEFGKTIPSIFTDEPQFAGKDPLGYALSGADSTFPWTYDVAPFFMDRYGYDIFDKLPEIIWNLKDGEISVARYHYHDCIAEMFASCFADNCGKWCSDHSLMLTGHMLCEESLELQTKFLGETMRSYRGFGIPGIDILCDDIQFSTAKQCQSAVHQYGREAMVSELYGVTNWDFDFRGHKFQGDWQAALGVTVRVPHLAWVSMAGEAKRDYPASINYQSPWHKEYPYIENHFARVNTALTRGVPDVRVGVIHPVESYWINFGPDESTGSIRNELEEKFQSIIDWLLFGTVDFDFICESTLPSQFGGTDGGFTVGAMKYDTVIVPDCMTLRRTTLDALKKFRADGGKVIFAGDCPKYIDAVRSDDAAELFSKSVRVPYDRIAILDALRDVRAVEIKNSRGVPTNNLIYNMRRDNGCRWMFIARGARSDKSVDSTDSETLRIYIKGECTPTLYNTLDGTIAPAQYTYENGSTVIPAELFGSDSLLFRLDDVRTEPKTVKPEKVTAAPDRVIRFTDKAEYRRTEPNVLLLDRAEYALDSMNYRSEEEILILDNVCRRELGWQERMDAFPQPWVVPDEPITHFINLRFTIHSEIDYSGAMLAIEDAETLEITLNGESVSAEVCGYYTDKSIKTVRLPELKCGKNVLCVKVPFGKRTNTEWCYILGDFNVRNEGAVSTVVPATDKIGFSDICAQGMPFYGGNLIYKAEISTPSCRARIHIPFYRGALTRVYVDGKPAGITAFSPYMTEVELSEGKHCLEFELFGTRINTFGGMHNVTQPKWVGPNYWRTTGDDWCYEYNLKRVGILSSPIVEIFNK